MDAGMRYVYAVSSARQTRAYLRDFGHRREVILRVLAADSVHAAWSMRGLIRRHLAAAAAAAADDEGLLWTINGGEQLDAAAELKEPLFGAMSATLLLLERLAGGFCFGPAVALVHAAVPLPHADGAGPGGMAFGVFERTHIFAVGNAGLARAVGYGGFTSTIARVLLRRPSTGLAFADEADAVDAEGCLETMLLCARALRHTDCAPLRAQAPTLAQRIMDARRLVGRFEEMRRLTHRRSRRSCRVAWASYFDRRFELLQRKRFAAIQLLHALGVDLLAFASQRLDFAPAPIA